MMLARGLASKGQCGAQIASVKNPGHESKTQLLTQLPARRAT